MKIILQSAFCFVSQCCPCMWKIKDTAVLMGWNKQIYIESFHFHSQGHKYGFLEGFIQMGVDSLSLYCGSQRGWQYPEPRESEKKVLDSEQDADWIRQNLWQPVQPWLHQPRSFHQRHPRLPLKAWPAFSFVFVCFCVFFVCKMPHCLYSICNLLYLPENSLK